MTSDFRRYSHVLCPRVNRYSFYGGQATLAEMQSYIEEMLQVFADSPPKVAICNSAETAIYADLLKRLGMREIVMVTGDREEAAATVGAGECPAMAAVSPRHRST